MNTPTYVIQSVSRPESFCLIEKRNGHTTERAVMAPWLTDAHHFPTSFAAEDFASRNFAAGSYRVRTMAGGELLAAGKELVKS